MVETRERILRTARDVVSEDGWQGAQIALIAARAGVATGSVYRYFESKSVLFAHVLAAVSEHEITIIRSHLDVEGPASERLSNAIQSFVRRALKSWRLAYALMAEPCEPEIDETRLKYRGAIAFELMRVLQEGIDNGELWTDATVRLVRHRRVRRSDRRPRAQDEAGCACGRPDCRHHRPACIRMVLANPGKPARALEEAAMNTPRDGSTPLLRRARRHAAGLCHLGQGPHW
jgi:AcrR family transcriptional regulator